MHSGVIGDSEYECVARASMLRLGRSIIIPIGAIRMLEARLEEMKENSFALPHQMYHNAHDLS